MKARELFLKIHLWLSVPAGVMITLICLTGAILVFEDEITELTHPELFHVTPPREGAVHLPPSAIMAAAEKQTGDTLKTSGMEFYSSRDMTCRIILADKKRTTLYADPYTGEVKGSLNRSDGFFITVRQLHKRLMYKAPMGKFSVGQMIVAVSTAAFVIIMLSGLVLWIPRSAKALRNSLKVKTTAGSRRLLYDMHNSLGFWCLIPVLIMALTGLTWPFESVRKAAYTVVGADMQRGKELLKELDYGIDNSHGRYSHYRRDNDSAPDYQLWDKALAQAEAAYPEYRYIRLRQRHVQVAADRYSLMRKLDVAQIDSTGNMAAMTRYEDIDNSLKAEEWMFAMHTGSWGGIWSKILWFAAALTAATLPATGYWLWIARLRGKRRRRAMQQTLTAKKG